MDKIELVQVTKAYGKNKPVIENLDLSIKKGSFTVLLGPSGCGKSTTLRMIAGLEKESQGEIFIDGQSMKNVEPADRDIAMVFQNYALYPTMTVRGNIEFGLINNKIPKDERKKRIDEICRIVGISDYLDRKPQSLSGGQRQRVALARAMVKRPSVFLMDEPLSNLDAKLRSQLRTELIELHGRLETTFIYVTHDQVEAMSMGTEIVLLNEGKIMQQDTPVGLYQRPDNIFTAQFVGTPPMNILSKKNLPEIWSQSKAYWSQDSSIEAIGFRPENVVLSSSNQGGNKDDFTCKGRIVTHEMLGSEVLYKIELAGERINVKVFTTEEILDGEICIHIAWDKLCFFDSQGQRLESEVKNHV